ncbi:MAG: dihydroorotase [Candidatus Obscuribacterales bacterium]|nr:dihydroorotase [Candidatus Obscuribacterales bacterium]
MTRKILIKNGLLIDTLEQKETKEDLRLADGEIIERGSGLKAAQDEEVIDAHACWVSPGLVDIHTHMRDLAQKDKEDLHSGSKAAAAGGFTTVVAMANTEPVLDSSNTLSLYLQKIASQAVIEVLPVAAVTKGLLGEELTNMVELAQLGAVAFSDDGKPVQNLVVLRRALQYVKMTGKVIISHAEDLNLAGGGCMHEGLMSTKLGLPGITSASETVAVARELEIVRLTESPYHFTHISCAASLDLIRRAQAEGLPVTVDVTPHHLSLTVDSLENYDTKLKMNPPLRTGKDRAALIEAIKDGTISAIATDHAPHSGLEKSRSFTEAPFGITGLETAFSVCYSELVLAKHIDRLKLLTLMTSGPAQVLDLQTPSLRPGARANICIIDPNYQWTYEAEEGYSRAHNSPWDKKELSGKVLCTIFKGQIVFQASQLAGRH